MSYSEDGQQVLDIEIEALTALRNRLSEDKAAAALFNQACETIRACEGRIVVIGMGKSGHISNKIAASLASTGTPAFFVHPGEASHGDLGMITPQDCVIALSNSGNTPEVLNIVPIVKRMGVSLISLTGKPDSELARAADIHINVEVAREACPHNLAPTASTTAALAMGDALAVAILKSRGFSADDFARTHPGGMLGKRLLMYVSDIMHIGEALPIVTDSASFDDLLTEMTSKSLGMAGVVNSQNELLGIFTDGDIRRTLAEPIDAQTTLATEVMTSSPYTVAPDLLAAELVKTMREHAREGKHAINGVFVTDEHAKVLGALNTHDLLRAGVV
ncbi:MAG: arabinose-5-phosphate isomerase [Gammaproteobacteria bacterium]|jgi:arabinose-5-phosphate isomerase